MFKERGELVLLKFAERLAEVGQPEALPKLEGKRMFLMLTPKTGKPKKKETTES
jgi:translation initiation factor IF-3